MSIRMPRRCKKKRTMPDGDGKLASLRYIRARPERENRVPTLKACSWALIFVALSALPARADGFFVPYIGFNYGGNSSNCASFNNCEDKHTNFGVAFGGMGKVVGFEQDIAYAKDFFGKVPGADNSVFTFMSNMLIGVGAGPVQPYGLFGFGLIRPHTSLNIASTVTDFSKN